MGIKLDCYLKTLGVIDVHNAQQKISTLDWDSIKLVHRLNVLNADNGVDFVLMFSLPDKTNRLLQNFFCRKELLELFKDEINQFQNIVDEHYQDLEPKRIFIDSILPGKQIAPHTDGLYHHENTKRIHLPIMTDDNAFFTFPGTKLKMKTGEVTEFNNSETHSAVNDSASKRVHMIIDFGRKGDPYYGKMNSSWKHYIGEE